MAIEGLYTYLEQRNAVAVTDEDFLNQVSHVLDDLTANDAEDLLHCEQQLVGSGACHSPCQTRG